MSCSQNLGSLPCAQTAGSRILIDTPPSELIASGAIANSVPAVIGNIKDEGALPLGQFEFFFYGPNGQTDNATFLSDPIVASIMEITQTEGATDPEVVRALRDEYFEERDLGDYEALKPGLINLGRWSR